MLDKKRVFFFAVPWLCLLLGATFADEPSAEHPSLVGVWTYRSFINDPDVGKPFNEIRFGAGTLRIEEISKGEVRGRLDFGEQFQLALRGWITFGNPVTVRFQGVGDRSGSKDWVYDYVGFYVPSWPNGVDQRPAIVGSIVRTQPHSNGQAPAGIVASWVAVRRDADEGNQPESATVDEAHGAQANPEFQLQLKSQHDALDRLQKKWEAFLLKRKTGEPEAAIVLDEASRPAPQRRALAEAATAPFQSPVEIRSQNGELQATLLIDYAFNQIGNDPVRLRSYNGKLVGPTLRAKPGDSLRITLRNNLSSELPHSGGHNTHHEWNTTNLHTHGLHVSPSGNSDNVLLRVEPGQTQEYEIHIPADHPAGMFWYHAHKHGAVAAQASSGMSGALVIEGGLDTVAEIAAAQERTFVLQQIPYWNQNLPYGVIELPYVDNLFGPGAWDSLGRFTTINGVQLPVIEMRPGEIQRWRLIHSGFRETLLLKLERAGAATGAPENLELHEIAVDGLALGKIDMKDKIELWPGNRSDVLIKAPDVAGAEYFLIDERTEEMDSLNGLPEERKYVAKLVIRGTSLAMELPDATVLKQYRLPSIAANAVTGTQTAVYSITAPPLKFAIDGKEYDPNHPRTLKLGDVEEWTVRSINNVGPVHHPFHIHVNPFEVFSIVDEQGAERLLEPVWRDTIILRHNWTVKFRTSYRKFTGKFVQHCHILDHEDQGMMELIEVVP